VRCPVRKLLLALGLCLPLTAQTYEIRGAVTEPGMGGIAGVEVTVFGASVVSEN
jgi:hypothetical protein